jgi:hypothetical protein
VSEDGGDLIPTPQCESPGCYRAGYVKSEEYGKRLCPEHAVSGPDETDPAEDECSSRRTVQVGRMSAIDLKCTMRRWQHREPLHYSSRDFGDVHMTARWAGEFQEPE